MVGEERDLWKREFIASGLNWIGVESLECSTRAEVKIRSSTEAAPARIEPLGKSVSVAFDEPRRGITPGQAAVFYQGDAVIGAGIIDMVPD